MTLQKEGKKIKILHKLENFCKIEIPTKNGGSRHICICCQKNLQSVVSIVDKFQAKWKGNIKHIQKLRETPILCHFLKENWIRANNAQIWKLLPNIVFPHNRGSGGMALSKACACRLYRTLSSPAPSYAGRSKREFWERTNVLKNKYK